MPEANSAPILSQLVSQSPRVKPGAATKPKLLYCLRDALCFHHSLAAHLPKGGYDILTVQELLGHKDVKTTMIYSHVLRVEKTEIQRRERSGHDAIVRSRRTLAAKLETSNGGKE